MGPLTGHMKNGTPIFEPYHGEIPEGGIAGDIFPVRGDRRPVAPALSESCCLGAVASHLPEPGCLRVPGVIYDPSIRRYGWIFRIRPIVRDLMRSAAIRVRHPYLKIAATMRTPDQVLPVWGIRRVPIIRWIVGESLDRAGLARYRTYIQIAGPGGRKHHPLTVWRDIRLSVIGISLCEPLRRERRWTARDLNLAKGFPAADEIEHEFARPDDIHRCVVSGQGQ